MGLFKWVGKALEESPGVPSSTRLIYLIITVMVAVIPVSLWAYICLKTGAIADFPGGAIALFSMLFAVVSGAKVMQQRNE